MIVVDSDNYDAAGIETMFFPGGEPHVKVPLFDSAKPLVLFLKLRTWADCGFAALLLDAIWRQEVDTVTTFIPYFPGARQDRSDGRSALTVEVMAQLLAVTGLHILDPHSSVLASKIAFRPMMPVDIGPHRRVGSDGVAGIIAPDKGAESRAYNYRNAFYPGVPILTGSKYRDPQSGALSRYLLDPLPKVGRYIIVDDICDGGGTFNLLAKAFFDQGTVASESKLEMFVSHGIFSKGIDAIDHRISRIVTTDSWCRESDRVNQFTGRAYATADRLEIIPLLPHFLKLLEDTRA